jgi:hypothetical protein
VAAAPVHAPVDRIEEGRKAKQAAMNDRLKSFETAKKDAERWVRAFANKKISVRRLRSELSKEGRDYLTRFPNLREVLQNDEPDADGRKKIEEELNILLQRITGSLKLVKGANELYGKLGIHREDYELGPTLLPEGDFERPEREKIENWVKTSRTAQLAREAKDRSEARRRVFENVFLLGAAHYLAPAIGGAADLVGKKDSAYGSLFLKPLYDDHVARQYFPSLSLLKELHDDAPQMAFMLEMLNGGSKDELLVTFARRPDMSAQWMRIKAYAKSISDSDSKHLYQRMVQAESRVFAPDGKTLLGTISVIEHPSTKRYIIAAIFWGAVGKLVYDRASFRQFCADHGVNLPPMFTAPATPAAEEVAAEETARLESVIRPEERDQTLQDLTTVAQAVKSRQWTPEAVVASNRLEINERELSTRLCKAAGGI